MLTIGQAMARASILSPQCAAMPGSIADSFHELASLQTEINVIFLHDRFKLSLMRIRPASSGSVFWAQLLDFGGTGAPDGAGL